MLAKRETGDKSGSSPTMVLTGPQILLWSRNCHWPNDSHVEPERDGNALEAEWTAICREAERSNQCLNCYWIFLDWTLGFCQAMGIGQKDIELHSFGSPSIILRLNMLITTYCQGMFWGNGITLQGATASGISELNHLWQKQSWSLIPYLAFSLPIREWPELQITPFSFPSQYYLSSWPCSCSCSKSVLLSPRGTEQGTDMTIPEVAFQHFITQNCFHQLPPKTREKLMCVRQREVR